MAEANYGANTIFTKSDSTKWWDGYSGQPVVLWDEIEKAYPFEIPHRYILSEIVKGS